MGNEPEILKKVVFDVDDILWSLNEKSSKMANIDRNDIVTYNTMKNPILSDEEKQRLINAYKDPSLFENIEWYDGISRINTLKADVYVNSNSLSKHAADLKYIQLKTVLTLPDNHIQINIIEQGKTKKEIDENTYIFIDDCPDNIMVSKAKYNIMMTCPWNSTDEERARLKTHPNRVFMCTSLNEIIDLIEALLNESALPDSVIY